MHLLLLGELAFGAVGTRLGLELSRADGGLTHAASLGSDEESISPRGRSTVEEQFSKRTFWVLRDAIV